VGETVAGQVLALEVSAGFGGFTVVLLLCLAAAGIFVMLSRSLSRMQRNVRSGNFGSRDKHDRQNKTDENAGDSAVAHQSHADVPTQPGRDRDAS
jgi:hypothetical protein